MSTAHQAWSQAFLGNKISSSYFLIRVKPFAKCSIILRHGLIPSYIGPSLISIKLVFQIVYCCLSVTVQHSWDLNHLQFLHSLLLSLPLYRAVNHIVEDKRVVKITTGTGVSYKYWKTCSYKTLQHRSPSNVHVSQLWCSDHSTRNRSLLIPLPYSHGPKIF